MRTLTTILMLVWAEAAQAHPGHIELIAGHDHWVGGAAIGIAILIGLAGALTGKGKRKETPEDEIEDEGAPA